MTTTYQAFTEKEQACIGRKIREIMSAGVRGEAVSMAQAQAIAISECAPGKAKSNKSVQSQVRDPAEVCGDIWFNGTREQRGAFGKGTEGRSREDRPPKAWFDD